jgi:hypothetical protein
VRISSPSRDQILTRFPLDSARDYRQGVEAKSWLGQGDQAKLYLERAQIALETVKVANITLLISARP